ncbi:MAG: methionyl-tRNA formyltransferase [Candidatus Zixiibacteriota bacterium]
MRIVFMGTPHFAIPSLERLLQSKHPIVGVATVSDKPQGRGLRLSESPVKRFALEHDLRVLTPEDLKSSDFIAGLKELNPDSIAVVAFRILPEEVFTIPRLGTINLHASLLPKYRGAAPINWAIINGETKTGLTTFYIRKKVDTGDVIRQKEIEIRPEENFGELHDRMANMGADLLLETLSLVEKGEVQVSKQDDSLATRAPKITPEHCRIDWSREAVQVKNLIRGLSPSPGAFTSFRGKTLKILKSAVIGDASFSDGFGEVADSNLKENVWIRTGRSYLNPLEVQLEGKKKVSIQEFIRGYRVKVGERFG